MSLKWLDEAAHCDEKNSRLLSPYQTVVNYYYTPFGRFLARDNYDV